MSICGRLVILVMMTLGFVSCDDAGTVESVPGGAVAATPEGEIPSPTSDAVSADVRLISLSPAITRTLVDLGIGNWIVGRSAFCDGVDPSIPVAGDLMDVNFETVVRLEPALILVQPPSAGLDPRLARLPETHGIGLGTWRLNDIDDIRGLVRSLPRFVAARHDRLEALRARSKELISEIDEALSLQAGWSGRVLLVDSVEPVLVHGSGSYLSEVLESLGARNAATSAGWPSLALEDVVRLNPEAVIIVRPGLDPGADPASLFGPLAALEIDAVANGRLAVLTTPGADTPSTALIDTAKDLATVLDGFAGARP